MYSYPPLCTLSRLCSFYNMQLVKYTHASGGPGRGGPTAQARQRMKWKMGHGAGAHAWHGMIRQWLNKMNVPGLGKQAQVCGKKGVGMVVAQSKQGTMGASGRVICWVWQGARAQGCRQAVGRGTTEGRTGGRVFGQRACANGRAGAGLPRGYRGLLKQG